MNKQQHVKSALLEQKMLPLYYHESLEVSTNILQALYKAGIRVVEYTNRGRAALQNFRSLKKEIEHSMPHLLLGIGTIKTADEATDFINAGADFIVCPTINVEVGAIAKKASLLWIPGCMTPTEIAMAESAGAEIVKIFPGNILGPGYINSIKELFPQMLFMPTGGVEIEAENLKSWFGAGVVAVGMGSKLITKNRVEAMDYEGLQNETQIALQLIKQVNPS